jgi:hypothetical protein
LGLYEVASYALPGAAYLTVFGILLVRFGWLPMHLPFETEPTLTFLTLTFASYVVGHIGYSAGREAARFWRQRIPPPIGRRGRPDRRELARAQFIQRCPTAQGRPFLDADMHVLLAAVQLRDRAVASEVERLNASSIMARNLVPPLLLGELPAVVGVFTPGYTAASLAAVVLLLVAAFACLLHGDERSVWAHSKILDLAFWQPDIDQVLNAGPTP